MGAQGTSPQRASRPRGKRAKADTAIIVLGLFDGARRPLVGTSVLVRAIDGNQKQVIAEDVEAAVVRLRVPFHDNLGDHYTVIASARGRRQAGFTPVKVNPDVARPVDLMLLPSDGVIRAVRWAELHTGWPETAALLARGAADSVAAQDRYDDLRENQVERLACLLNLTTAMADIRLRVGTALSYVRHLIWEEIRQDRLFAWADAAMLEQVHLAAEQGQFTAEVGVGFFHPGATRSYKQTQFGEANVQLTFHENDRATIDGVDCVKLEPDIDYFRDPAAHALLEVIPHRITGSLTDPRSVYVLRWMAGRQAGVAEFHPPYTIEMA